MKIIILIISVFMVFKLEVSIAEQKDPKLRDENISATKVSVKYFMRQDGLMEYVYTINSPLENKGILGMFLIDLMCSNQFEAVSLPYADGKEGYLGESGIKGSPYTPVAIHADYGSASPYGITTFGSAMWGLYHIPGSKSAGLRLITTAKPGMRAYSIEPYMDNDASWAYPKEPDPAIPWIPDFTITGMIAGPGCPGVTEPPGETNLFAGTGFRVEPENINKLLQYRTPQKDRFHVDAGTKETILHIFYSDDIDEKTFKVQPAYLKHYFNPVAGSDEKVTLPLKKARNKMKLSVHTTKSLGTTRKENESHHSYKDTDVFEIRVNGSKK